MKALAPAAMLILLSACQSAGTAEPGSLGADVDLPPDYRRRAAAHLVSEYLRDAIGPAEITTEPRDYGTIFGASSRVLVRYPVRMRPVIGGWILEQAGISDVRVRCITVVSKRTIGTGGEVRFMGTRPRTDGTSCGDGESFEPYRELDEVAGRLKACRARGEERCLLTTNMPGAEARKLMNRP